MERHLNNLEDLPSRHISSGIKFLEIAVHFSLTWNGCTSSIIAWFELHRGDETSTVYSCGYVVKNKSKVLGLHLATLRRQGWSTVLLGQSKAYGKSLHYAPFRIGF